MLIDPHNPVVQCCVRGLAAEAQDDPAGAAAAYAEAWALRQSAVDACIAAHYLARVQTDPAALLEWNQRALKQAAAADPALVADFLPSLHLNLGYAWEQCGAPTTARAHYSCAATLAAALPADSYGALVRDGAARGLARLEAGS